MERLTQDNAAILSDEEFSKILEDSLGPLASNLLLIPADGSDVDRLPFGWQKAKDYYVQFCQEGTGNEKCPNAEYEEDCTHFVGHGLSKTRIIVDLPSVTCDRGICIKVKELAAAFKNSTGRYNNVTRITSLSQTREGDFCFITSWFDLVKDHVMVLSNQIDTSGGKVRARVWGHTNSRCAGLVDLTDESLVIYRIS